MKRRAFIAGLGGAAAWPVVPQAQQGERVRRVGVLTFGSWLGQPSGPTFARCSGAARLEEGRNLQLDVRFGDGDARKTSVFAADLVQLAPPIEAFAVKRNGGLIPSPAMFAIVQPDELSRLALQYRLPTVFGLSVKG